MRVLQNTIMRIWDKVLVAFGILFVLLPISPLNMKLDCCVDSGVFLYAGWRILNRGLPYRDFWDHKPPIIFYIDALGEFFWHNSRWGVWIIEFISLFLAAYICFQLIKKAFGSIPAVITLLLWLLTLVFVIEGGNLTEEYTLPLQFAALWLAYDSDKPTIEKKRYFLIGLIGALAFFTKQTTIGIWIAIIIFLTFRRLTSHQTKRWLNEISFFFWGGFSLTIVIVIFFGVQDALPQFWDAAFKYNFIYSSSLTGIGVRLSPVINGIKLLSSTGLLQLSMIGYVFAVILIVRHQNGIRNQMALLAIGLIDLPIELILVSTSGETYSHYYMALLPILALFAGLIFWVFLTSLSSWGITNATKYIIAISIAGILLWISFGDYYNEVMFYRYNKDNNDNIVVSNYIKSITSPKDFVLLWGAETTDNYNAQRRSPTRFVYQFPLYKQGYVNEEIILEFLDDIIQNSPRLIVDTNSPATPIFDFPIQTDAIKERITFIQSHYLVIKTIDLHDNAPWIVYEYNAQRH